MNHASLYLYSYESFYIWILDLTMLLALANGTLARVMQVKDW